MTTEKQTGHSRDYGSAGRSLDDLKIEVPENEAAKYPELDKRQLIQYYQEEMEKLKERLTFFLKKKLKETGRPISTEEFEGVTAQLKNLEVYGLAKAWERMRARLDALTGFFAKEALPSSFEIELKRLNENKDASKALVYLRLDMDYFKDINDKFGHQAGDDILKAIGQAAAKRLRATDTKARMGGDEFVFMLADVKKDDAVRIVTEIIDFIKNNVTTPEGKNITFSVGMRMVEYGSKDFFEQVDGEADAVARLAKSQRNMIEVYDDKTHSALEKLLKNPDFVRQNMSDALARVIGEPNEEEAELIARLAEAEIKKRDQREK